MAWYKGSGICPVNSNGTEMARFQAGLHLAFKLSYNTILLYKSVPYVIQTYQAN